MQACGQGRIGDNKGHSYIAGNGFLHGIQGYTSMVVLLPGASADQITAGGRSENPQMIEPLERASEITRNDMMQG